MKYLGGKSKTCERIASYINTISDDMPYVEPFCGACWVTQHIASRVRIALDIHPGLIAMWKKLQDGWIPPTLVTERMYKRAKNGAFDDRPHLKAFIGFGCSWGGKWFGGYAREGKRGERNYALESRNGLLEKVPRLKNVYFACIDYRDVSHSGCIIYCDPPYAGTTGYANDFDSEEFWSYMRKWSKNNIVIISEYKAPEDFNCILRIPIRLDVRTVNGSEIRVEKLFVHKNTVLPELPITQRTLNLEDSLG